MGEILGNSKLCIERKQQGVVLEPGFEIWVGICQADKEGTISLSRGKCLRTET